MAESLTSSKLVEHGDSPGAETFLLFRRPTARTGLVSWLTTVDHKRIGMMYGFFAVCFFMLGGVEALLIRTQLMVPNNHVVTAHFYSELFTMHGTTMIFLAVMPLNTAFFNLLVPLQIGARDVAFPRLNAFSLWLFVAGAIILNVGWFLKAGAPAAGWFGYAPLTSKTYTPDISADLWTVGLQVLGVSSIVGSLNFITTIINLRAPGMTMMRLPVFTWMALFTSFLLILALPSIAVALIEVIFDRHFGTNFFEVSNGGQPILWQHLFWIFGHPEVYILILPAMGYISEILPTFSGKPLFGYPIMVFSGALIGFIGFGVWSHHMFTTGMGTVATSAFALATMAIAVPTGVKIFNWIGTLWGGHLRLRTPMMFALGFLFLFMMGGFSGIMHSAAPADSQQHNSYFVVAHFHYVLIGGATFGLLAAIHFWFPKFFGRLVDEFWGKVSFWVIFVGFNTTFFPMHFLGLDGMPRRTWTYDSDMGWSSANFISTMGAYLLGVGILIYVLTIVWSLFNGVESGPDPWDARSLEWSLSSPPPVYNFVAIPTVRDRDAWWYEKRHPRAPASAPGAPVSEEKGRAGIHMPDQSWYPLASAASMLVAGLFFAASNYPAAIGAVAVMFAAIYLWSLEGPGGYHVHPS